ncbi:MAG TPA: hypothetical protein VM261_29040 [Kofleriaceae bacterium]|nr:hypothetical protein [Kofleriaceae bacterium]
MDCIERRRNASCDRTTADWRTVAASCAGAFRGEVPNGGTCYLAVECRDGDCPVNPCSVDTCCSHTCVDVPEPAHRGESCAGRPCVDGSFCNEFQICTALVAAGGACSSWEQCSYGLYCNGSVCANTPGRGEPCSEEICENWFGDRCLPASGTCEPLAAAGEPCEWSTDCQLPLLCEASICSDPPEVGEPCVDSGFCRVGAYCSGGICVAQQANGEPCAGGLECKTLFCDGATATSLGTCADTRPCE